MPDRRRTWPYNGQAASPPALTRTPDTVQNSERSLAGPLRVGTAPGAGPRGGGNGGSSDLGMDRVSPVRSDPIGTNNDRWAREGSTLVSRR